MNCLPWDAEGFRGLLASLRHLTREKEPTNFLPELKSSCAKCGVAVVIAQAPSGCRASGATLFVDPTKALLLLSFRYLSDDHFWFTFFHEAGHLLLHTGTLRLEGCDEDSTNDEEEANQFAARLLIPAEFESTLSRLSVDGREVVRIARKIGISPGILVGQLQHRGRLTHRQLNNLKRRYSWG